MTDGGDLQTVLRYHRETKHHFRRYARGPGYLDWANQPDPFRRYRGAPRVPLPRLAPADDPRPPPYASLYRAGAVAPVAVDLRSVSRLFEYSLAITAWKQAGETRWALRANPSSGNLHPTEGYLLIGGVPDLPHAPALFHYTAREHALELRASLAAEQFAALLQGFPPQAFIVGLSSVHWREAWKYGERAFRYCQHDVGHALGALRLAAQALGWRLLLLDAAGDDAIAALLGLDRAQDFAGAEREHPDCLAVVWPGAANPVSVPLALVADAVRAARTWTWHGRANRLSRGAVVRWPMIEEVERATWKPAGEPRTVDFEPFAAGAAPQAAGPSAGELIHRRRSALAFDGVTALAADAFFAMLARTLPHADLDGGRRPPPWDALPWPPAIDLALFVHRVEGLAPGLYWLARAPARVAALQAAMHDFFAWRPIGPPALPLFLLEEGDARRMAIDVSCHQDIAGDGCFSLGMIAEFEPNLRRHGAWFYRRLFWETGVIGQVLYLEAEAHGVRATGIGCYFDDPVHQVLGLRDATFQSLYHFTVGAAVEDPRLTTLPPYESAT
jgi:SagB-type dehydrogenase family enzyme